MPRLSELCSVCLQATDAAPLISDRQPVSHETYASFREAASQGCFICFTIWNFSEQHAAAWAAFDPNEWETSILNLTCQLILRRGGSETGRFVVYANCKDLVSGGSIGFYSFIFTPPQDLSNSTSVKNDGEEESSVTHDSYTRLNVQRETSSDFTLDLAREWLQTCRTCHPRCNQPGLTKHGDYWLPTRLIDIGIGDETHWKLCITSQDQISPSAAYMALSYCWGASADHIKLLSSNLNDFRRGSPICDLPRTFYDLVSVARRFSVRYVWIDSLCIMQDSIKDREVESATMGDVYARSFCTVAASASSDAKGGLFRARDPDFIQAGLVRTKLGVLSVLDTEYWNRHMLQGTLHTRGWAFQERFLSPRVLYFARHQVLWECGTDQKCEAFPRKVPFNQSLNNLDTVFANLEEAEKHGNPSFRVFAWVKLIEEYSKCNLTVPSDRLMAVAGIAHPFQALTGDERISPPIAPSWSWASVQVPVKWDRASQKDFLFSIEDVCRENGQAGEITGTWKGHLQIRGVLQPAVCEGGREAEYDLTMIRLNLGAFSIQGFIDLDTMTVELVERQTVWCLPFYIKHWESNNKKRLSLKILVLQEADSDSDLCSFRRIGLLSLDDVDKESLGKHQMELDWDREPIARMSDKANFSSFRLV